MSAAPQDSWFRVLGQQVRVRCRDAASAQVVQLNFAPLAIQPPADGRVDLHVRLDGEPGDLIHRLERDLVVALQRRRPELLFLHAAALERGGRACLLAGESGHGKSTLAWGLLHHGFGYLSDELSPLDLDALQVHAYPHALCLKQPPSADYPLPAAGVLRDGRCLRVPVGSVAPAPCDVAAVLFVRHRRSAPQPVLRAVGAAEAAARLYVVALNALAHPARGLDAVARVAERVPCLMLESADLRATCRVVDAWARGAGL